MLILIAGDLHGAWSSLQQKIDLVRAKCGIEAVIQVGDFGFYRSTFKNLDCSKKKFSIPVYAIDGNNEDHNWLARAEKKELIKKWQLELNLFYQPRPSVAAIGGKLVGFLGGALHVIRDQEHNWISGRSNYIKQSQTSHAADLFNQHKPDLIVTHSCPAGIGIGLQGSRFLELSLWQNVVNAGFDPGPQQDRGEDALRELWQKLEHRPAAWVFGHFHEHALKNISGTYFACAGEIVNEEPSASPVLLWDSANSSLQWFTL